MAPYGVAGGRKHASGLFQRSLESVAGVLHLHPTHSLQEHLGSTGTPSAYDDALFFGMFMSVTVSRFTTERKVEQLSVFPTALRLEAKTGQKQLLQSAVEMLKAAV